TTSSRPRRRAAERSAIAHTRAANKCTPGFTPHGDSRYFITGIAGTRTASRGRLTSSEGDMARRLAWLSVVFVGAFAVACGGKTNDLGDGTQDSTTSGDSGTTSDGPTGDTTPPPFDAPTTDGIPPGDGPLPDVPTPGDATAD